MNPLTRSDILRRLARIESEHACLELPSRPMGPNAWSAGHEVRVCTVCRQILDLLREAR